MRKHTNVFLFVNMPYGVVCRVTFGRRKYVIAISKRTYKQKVLKLLQKTLNYGIIKVSKRTNVEFGTEGRISYEYLWLHKNFYKEAKY